MPIGINFAAGGYAYTEADISVDPVLRIENVNMAMQTWAVGYIRTFELLKKSARVEVLQWRQEGRWSGLVDGVPTSVKRQGWADTVARLAVNLVGAPPLEGKEYAAYRAKTDVETLVGAALSVQLPTGQYKKDKLINLGSNRFTFRPQLGFVHNRGRWSFEATGAAWIYTDNNSFFNGNLLEQNPLYTLQAHLVHTFPTDIWVSASAGYGYGGQSTVNGIEKNNRKENIAWAIDAGYPITRRLNFKATYIGIHRQTNVGADSDTLAIGLSTNW